MRIFSERSPEPICERRAAVASACWRWSSCSYRRARRIRIARSRFWICERSSWQATTSPVGRWVTRTAESVVFTDWPPGPVER